MPVQHFVGEQHKASSFSFFYIFIKIKSNPDHRLDLFNTSSFKGSKFDAIKYILSEMSRFV